MRKCVFIVVALCIGIVAMCYVKSRSLVADIEVLGKNEFRINGRDANFETFSRLVPKVQGFRAAQTNHLFEIRAPRSLELSVLKKIINFAESKGYSGIKVKIGQFDIEAVTEMVVHLLDGECHCMNLKGSSVYRIPKCFTENTDNTLMSDEAEVRIGPDYVEKLAGIQTDRPLVLTIGFEPSSRLSEIEPIFSVNGSCRRIVYVFCPL